MSWKDTTVMCHDFARILTYDEIMSKNPLRPYRNILLSNGHVAPAKYPGHYWHKPFFDKYGNSIVKVTRFIRAKKFGKNMRIKFILPKCDDVQPGYTLPVYVPEVILEKKVSRIKIPNKVFTFE